MYSRTGVMLRVMLNPVSPRIESIQASRHPPVEALQWQLGQIRLWVEEQLR